MHLKILFVYEKSDDGEIDQFLELLSNAVLIKTDIVDRITLHSLFNIALEPKSLIDYDIVILFVTKKMINNVLIFSSDLAEELINFEYSKSHKKVIPLIIGGSSWLEVDFFRKLNVITIEIQKQTNEILQTTRIEKRKSIEMQHHNAHVEVIDSITKIENKQDKKSSDNKSIFISHSHKDGDFAELLKDKLDKEGFDAWLDSDKLKVGQNWKIEIDNGIKESLAVILIMSPDARQSEFVTYEWSFAMGKEIPIFPILLTQTQMHPKLEDTQYLDFTNRRARPYRDLYERLKKLDVSKV